MEETPTKMVGKESKEITKAQNSVIIRRSSKIIRLMPATSINPLIVAPITVKEKRNSTSMIKT